MCAFASVNELFTINKLRRDNIGAYVTPVRAYSVAKKGEEGKRTSEVHRVYRVVVELRALTRSKRDACESRAFSVNLRFTTRLIGFSS